jgi:protein-S-isoprenylcysteine O-methyltransferase Ste14
MARAWLQRLQTYPLANWGGKALHRSVYLTIDGAMLALAMWYSDPTRTSLSIGSLLVTVGLVLRAISSIAVMERGSPSIVGIFKYVRAPYLLGSLLIWLGASLAGRSFGLVLASLILVAIFACVIALVEGRAKKSDNFVRMAYLRDVPLLVPQLLPFRIQTSIIEAPRVVRLNSSKGIFREWPGILICAVVLIGFWAAMNFLNLHKQIIFVATIVVAFIVVVTVFRDWKSRSRADFSSLMRF